MCNAPRTPPTRSPLRALSIAPPGICWGGGLLQMAARVICDLTAPAPLTALNSSPMY